MRVTDFVPYQQDAERLGLLNINMHRLGHTVILVGPNGAGKSRMLTVLRESLVYLRAQYKTPNSDNEAAILRLNRTIATSASPSNQDMQQFQNRLDAHMRLRALRQKLRFEPEITHANIGVAVFSAANASLADPTDLPPSNIKQHYESAMVNLGTHNLNQHAPSYISHVASRYWNATHPETQTSAAERESARLAWESLKSIVGSLLSGATLSRDENGVVLINDRPIARAGLSDGQKALLVAAATLHAQSTKLDEAIILIDEPELHLHPSALIEFVDRLIAATPSGQVWIATHSVHILSHVDPSSMWFVDGGTSAWAGKRPEIVLARLVGDDERVGRLQKFLQLPAIYAMERFVAECLAPPTIVSTGAEDPQSTQIRAILADLGQSRLRVLDYGAGTGRLLAALQEGTQDLSIDYIAYEKDAIARRKCQEAIATAYGVEFAAAAGRVSADEATLRAGLNRNTVHVVVMCNVLHEIPPAQWPGIFTGIIAYCLHPDGYLLLVEDMHIPHGEHAHKHGFVLLDTEQLKELFNVDRENQDQFRSFGTERLKAHLVRADALTEVSSATLKEALKRRRDSAKSTICVLRDSEPNFRNGHLLGLYAMLHANASLALDEL